MKRLSPSTLPRTRSTPRKPLPGSMPGSWGWQAILILYSSATGTTRFKKYAMRSQAASALTSPASVSGGSCAAIWIVGVASHPDFVFLGDRDDPLQEIRDALPGGFRADQPGFGERRVLRRFLVDERAVMRAAAAARGLRPHHAQDGQIVFQRGDAGARGIANHLADCFDFAVALGAFAQHDIGVFRARDVTGT